jgi:CRP/FNR family transcriptional regulator, cyclic AMP receptor protein
MVVTPCSQHYGATNSQTLSARRHIGHIASKKMKSKSPNDFKALLLTGRWFRSLPSEFQDHLLAASRVKVLSSRERLFSRGDPPSGIFAMVEGAILVTAFGDGDKEALLTITEPPTWFGEIAAFDELERTHDAIAASESTVLHVSQERLHAILAAEPRWWRDLALLVTSKLRLALVAMEESAILPVRVRLARRLVLIAERYGEWNHFTSKVIGVRQEQLAMMLAVSRQTINQLLKELQEANVIKLSYGEIEILDLEGIRKRGVMPISE